VIQREWRKGDPYHNHDNFSFKGFFFGKCFAFFFLVSEVGERRMRRDWKQRGMGLEIGYETELLITRKAFGTA
jgi:hypothetical protein